MAIKSYTDEKNETRFQVYVNLRSKVKQNLRAQRRVSGFKSKKDAEKEEKKLIRECECELNKKEAEGDTWGAVVESWQKFLELEKGTTVNEVTRGDYIASLKKHTASWWNRPAASLSKSDVKVVLNQLEANGHSKSGQNVVKVIVNRAFTYGIESGFIKGLERSPAYGMSIGRREEKKPEILTLAQLKKLLSSARSLAHPWYPVWAMAVLTGMRNGELFALLWQDVDWDNRELSVTKSYNTRTRRVKCTKSGDWRTVPISSELLSVLKELQKNAGARVEILPRLPGWEKGYQAKMLRAFCEGLGLPSVKFHTLRACFATQLIRNGVAPIQLQKICGWKDLETMQRYVRLSGIESHGVTEVLKVLPAAAILGEAGEAFMG
jgi:integrase